MIISFAARHVSSVDCKLLKRQSNEKIENLMSLLLGQMMYSMNSSEINTKVYDFRVKKLKISTATKSDSNGKVILPMKFETRTKTRVYTFYYDLTTSFRFFPGLTP